MQRKKTHLKSKKKSYAKCKLSIELQTEKHWNKEKNIAINKIHYKWIH